MRDPYLHGHCERLAALAVRLALRLGVANGDVESVRLGAVLHDIGKIGIPDAILLKEGPLDDDEMAKIRLHPVLGDELLEPIDLLGSSRPIVRHHHERWDGNGYPDRLAGPSIPLGARIVAVADSIEVMASRSLYRPPRTQDEIVAELRAGAGSQWDPCVIELALELFESGEIAIRDHQVVLLGLEESPERRQTVPVLLVEDDADHALLALEAIVSAIDGASVSHVRGIAAAAELCRQSAWSLAVVDHRLPDGSGLDLLETMRGIDPQLPIVMLTGQGSERLAVEAFRRGASDYVVKSSDYLEQLTQRVRDLTQRP
jgi:response regulator RpfG family c-di-GMP phosphodiesterase